MIWEEIRLNASFSIQDILNDQLQIEQCGGLVSSWLDAAKLRKDIDYGQSMLMSM